MDAADISEAHKNNKLPKPMLLVLGALIFAFLASFIATSLRQYGGFNYSGHTTALFDAIIEAVGAVFIFPLIHLAISSLWKTKRNSRSRRNIFFGWGVAVGIIQIFNITQTSSFRQSRPAVQSGSHVTTVADPNQSMEGSYCDRLAAVGKSMVNGRDKGTRRTTLETAITNAAEISESERVVYRQMARVVYNDSSLTEAAMYERIHEACEKSISELTEDAESDRG